MECGSWRAVAVALRQDHVQKQVDFRYNKTKEDVLLPVLNLLLGNPPDFRPRQAHPPTEALERLREDSFAMYHMAKQLPVWGRDPGQSVGSRAGAMGPPCEEGRSRSIFWQRWTAAWWDPDGFFTVWRRSIWRGTVWRGLRCGGRAQERAGHAGAGGRIRGGFCRASSAGTVGAGGGVCRPPERKISEAGGAGAPPRFV